MRSKEIYCPLNKKGDFKEVFDHGSRFSSRYFVIYAKPNGLAFSRLGLSVSKKIGNAVVRNRIKRRLREAVRKRLKENPVCYDIIIVARSSSVEADFADLNKQIIAFFSKVVNEKYIDINHKVL